MVSATPPAIAKTALQFLQESPKPASRSGHTLPPLTRWGWEMPFDVRVELTERWGYALEFGPAASESYIAKLADSNSVPSRICALTASNPARYPLFVVAHRPLLDREFLKTLPPETWCHDASGNVITNGKQWVRWSPEMPDSVYQRAAAATVAPLAMILKRCPIAVILNGGEYGLNVYGHSGKVWEQDPKVVAAKGERSWLEYTSKRKAHYDGGFPPQRGPPFRP
jgi:hypothetical protein